MKTRITFLIAAVAVVTLSFTFANVDNTKDSQSQNIANSSVSTPVGGIMADEVVK